METVARLTVEDLGASERQLCEIYTRVMGYHRPVAWFNHGKQSEYRSACPRDLCE